MAARSATQDAARRRQARRLLLIGGCAVATLVVLDQARPNAARESRAPGHTSGVGEAAVGKPIELTARNQLPPLRGNPFAPRVEPSPPPAAPAPQVQGPPPGPQVPPVPYRFVGKVTYGGNSRVALTAGDRIHLVVEGDAVDGGYVVRKITEDKVTLAYTPFGVDHELALITEASVPTPAPIAAPAQAPVQIAAEITAAPAPRPAQPVERR